LPVQTKAQAKAVRKFQDALKAFEKGDDRRAGSLLAEVSKVFPDEPDVCHLHGLVLLRSGRAEAAVPKLEKAAASKRDAELWNALGGALRRAGAAERAVHVYGELMNWAGPSPRVLFNRAVAYRDLGRVEEEIAGYLEALEIDPRFDDARFNLGQAFKAQGRHDEALRCFKEIHARSPEDPEVLNSMGVTCLEMQGQGMADAARYLQHAADAAPDYPRTFANLARLYAESGRPDDAVAASRRALALGVEDPAAVHSNLIFGMCYLPQVTNAELLTEARNWAKAHAPKARAPSHANSPDPDRPLRIGYVSGDFRRHPVGDFFLPLARNHSSKNVAVFCYANSLIVDDLTRSIQGEDVVWRPVAALPDAAVADMVRADGIDILVDLSGHAQGHRLSLFALKPAPVQATGGGIFCTSGVDAIDVILADRFEIPEGADDGYSETVVRLPDGYVCYAPPDYAPPVSPRPSSAGGPVTFGSFNNLAKLNERTVELWARVLARVEGSRLLLKSGAFDQKTVQDDIRGRFEAAGIDPARILTEGGAPHAAFLGAYGQVDVALDTLGYSGGLTTLEALWMGVPVVTLPGETFAARHALTHLSNAGFTDWVARDADHFVEIAAGLASDPAALAALSAGMREQMPLSPVCDGARYARSLEDAYRRLWRDWCAGR
jgi:predicted O-linked N-acetylglucosamine transferase (SPINDLY family)